MVSFPNAKINLGLNITEKRLDGFHSIESCFYPVQWSDVIEMLPAPQLTFASSGIQIPGNPEDNLCLKVYHSLKKDFDLPPVSIHLLKNIPIGAGLGGGSADAAFTIKILNSIFNLGLTPTQMEEYVRPIGSDCAFFIENKPVFAYGKGDQFSKIELSLKGFKIIIVYPEIHISTKEAYAGVIPQKPKMSIESILNLPMQKWKVELKNDFEDSLFSKYADLKDIKDSLYLSGAVYASMTGSGSAIYGIFETDKALSLHFRPNYKVWSGFFEV